MEQGHFLFELTFAVLALAALSVIGVVLLRINRLLLELKGTVDSTRRQIEPVIEEAHQLTKETREGASALLTRTQATVDNVTTRSDEIADMVHDQAVEIRALTRDAVLATRNQVERLDGLLAKTTTRVNQTTAMIQQEVLEPIHELHCLITGVRRGLQVFFRKKRTPVDQVYQDEELFI